MHEQTLEYLQDLIERTAHRGNLRETIEKFLASLRRQFVFDNVAVYLHDEKTASLEIVYARALGRARNAEADAAWGESFASQVLAQGRLLIQDPKPGVASDDRLHQAYLLGLPIGGNSGLKGALIFVRFGRPVYTEEHIRVARIAADLLFRLFERAAWRNTNAELRELKRQMQLQEDFVSTISHELRTHLRDLGAARVPVAVGRLAGLPAEELVHRQAGLTALDVPQRHVDALIALLSTGPFRQYDLA